MANFNKESTKKIVRDIMAINQKILNDPKYISTTQPDGSHDDVRLSEIYGSKGLDVIKEMVDFVAEFNTIHAPAEPTFNQLIQREVYDKFTQDELDTMTVQEIIDDARINWTSLIDALEKKYTVKADADAIKNRLVLTAGRILGNGSSFTLANLSHLDAVGEKTLMQEERDDALDAKDVADKKASYWRWGTIGTGVVAGGLVVSLLFLAFMLKNEKIKLEANEDLLTKAEAAVTAQGNYSKVELEELFQFNTSLDAYRPDGLTRIETLVLQNDINEYAKTDDASYGFSTTNEMKALLEAEIAKGNYAELEKLYDILENKYNTLLAATPSNPTGSFDYVQFLTEMNDIQNMLIDAISDNQFTDKERKEIKDKLAKVSTQKEKIAEDLANTYGVSVDEIYETIDYHVAQVSTDVAKLNKEIDDLNKEVDSLEKTIKLKDSTITARNSTISKLNKEISSLEQTIEDLEDVIDSLQDQLANSGSNTVLASQLAKALDDLAAAKTKYNKLNANYLTLQSDYSDLLAENADLTLEISVVEAEVVDLKADIKTLKSENKTLTSECAKYIKQIAGINSDYDILVADYNKKVAEYNQLVSDYEELEEKLNNSTNQNEIDRLNDLLQQKIVELSKANNDLVAANQKMEELELEIADLEKQIENMANAGYAKGSDEFIIALYESLGGNPTGKSVEQIIADLSNRFDIDLNNSGSSNSSGDLGNQPIK